MILWRMRLEGREWRLRYKLFFQSTMIIQILIILSFFLLLGLATLNVRRVINIERESRALMYNSDVVQFILSSSMILLVILSMYVLFFFSWELFVTMTIIGLIMKNRIIVPLTEDALGAILNKIVSKIDNKKKK